MKKFIAFTLAETLIVMGIIGVVAALTLPNLNSSTADKEKVVKVKKLYQNLEDAFGRAVSVYGPVNEWFINDDTSNQTKVYNRFLGRISDFIKITGNTTQNQYSWAGWQILSDSSAVDFGCAAMSPNCDSAGDITSCGDIIIDIDGPNKGKNEIGKDIFKFYVTKDGLIPLGSPKELSDDELKSECFNSKSYCTGWVIQNENMDYLKADNTGKCPNGTQLSWSNTSCK